MKRSTFTIQIVIFIIAIAQVVLDGTFVIFYCLNIFQLQEILKPLYLVIGSGSLVLFNCVSIFIIASLLISMKTGSEIRTSNVLSNDVQEIYNFVETAIVVTDDKNIVIWESELFQNRHIDLFGADLLQKFPELGVLRDKVSATDVAKIHVNGRTYEAKLIQETSLWIFKDISDFESAYHYSKNNSVVFGHLIIDNYEDIVSKDEILNDIENRLRTIIHSYFKDYQCLLKRTKEDSYFLVTSFECYKKMREENFSILDKVRELSEKDVTISLSIGFAYDFPDLVKLNEYALNALDVALSRGGDQIVSFPYGREIEFYGGRNVSVERTNKVKMRSLSDSVISIIKGVSDVLIMGHTYMDMDAFGACLGMKAIADRLEKSAKIVVDLKNTEKKTKAAILSTFAKNEIDEIMVSPKRAEAILGPNTLLIVLDVHVPSMTMDPVLVENAGKIMVIDHHRRGKDVIDNTVFSLIDPGSTSTSELVTELIKYCPINPTIDLSSTYATFMLSGIFLDSSYFKNNSTGLKSFEAAAILKEFGASNSTADDYLKDDYEEHKQVEEIMKTFTMPYNGVAIAYGDENELYDIGTIAKVANEILCFRGVHAVFTFGRTTNKNIKLSARSDGTINVQMITEKLGGGGSFSASAVNILDKTIEEAKEMIEKAIGETLEAATNTDKKSKEE